MILDGMEILVVGAGIGGLAVARGLALRGANVTVLEQAEAITEVGAGLQISPNGFAVLQALGLTEALVANAVQGTAVSLRDYRGGEVLRLDLTQLKSHDYYFVHRADLINLLAEGAREVGVKIRLLQKVVQVLPGKRPRLELANGAAIDGDVVIGADGLHSCIRTTLNGSSAPFFTQQVAWRAVVPNTFSRLSDVQVHMGPKRHVVSYPLRCGKQLNIVAVQERAEWAGESWSQEDDPMSFRTNFDDFHPEVKAMLEAVERVHLWGLFRHNVAKAWYGPGVAILGDAAHPTLPFLAQGASMALEDGWVLADALAAESSVGRALASYQKRRETRVCRVIAAATRNARKYHLSFAPMRWIAHTALRAGGMLAPVQMMRQFDWLYDYDVTRQS